MKRVGVYGGSFNPCHNGHVRAALDFIIRGRLDELLVCPVYKHPYGKELADFDVRAGMCLTAFKPLRDVHVKSTEMLLYKFHGSRGLTAELLESLAPGGRYGRTDRKLVLCVGDDVGKDMASWEGFERIKNLQDAGHLEFLASSRVQEDVSSTMIRRLAKEGDPDGRLSQLVHPALLDLVSELYR